MITLKVGGVPEHFNLPIHLAIEKGLFEQQGIEIHWIDFPGGTGAMNEALRNSEIDLAIILTEGIIRDIARGNPSRIIQNYVASPLIWGVHVAAESDFKTIDDLENARVAISRIGSGSHLMAFIQAKEKGWDTDSLTCVEVLNLENAIKNLTAGKADYFMWEHFTTKPLVDSGIFRRVGDFPTPWSSFVIAATESAIEKHSSFIALFLEVINTVTTDFKQIPSIDQTLAVRYGQKKEDIVKWLEITHWAQNQIAQEEINLAQKHLKELEMIDKIQDTSFYLTNL